MVLSKEQAQTRFLAIVLPTLTLCTHTLLALSFALPGSEQYRAFWSLVYNSLAACASILGLIGAVRRFVRGSSDTWLNTRLTSDAIIVDSEFRVGLHVRPHDRTALSFVTLALVNIIVPFDAGFLNPVIPSWHVDEGAICRDVDARFGWDEEWLVKCSKHFYTVMLVVAWSGLLLMFAQWWALWTVRRWGKELKFQRLRAKADMEKLGFLDAKNDFMRDEKTRV